jgi:hypothetical protein
MRDFGKYNRMDRNLRGKYELAFEVIAKDHVHLAIRDEQSGRLTVPGLFAVIPANLGSASGVGAGIPVGAKGLRPHLGDRRSPLQPGSSPE